MIIVDPKVVITDPKIIHHTEPCIVTGKLRVWADVREDGKDKFVREFENCEVGSRLAFNPKNWYKSSY